MREARVKGAGGDCYHVMSRIIERKFVLGDVEKEVFRKMLRKCEAFSGVNILTYVLMDNHFHVLVEVPERGDVSDTEFLRRLGALYPRPIVQTFAATLKKIREAGGEKAEEKARKIKAQYTYRMGDVSEFLKTLKQRFTMWYNHRESRHGTLWEDRFKSILVEGRGHALATMAAYIDLNAVRAGLVSDPKDYRYCGYGEAVAGNTNARAGLGRVMESLSQSAQWTDVRRGYRKHVYLSGEKTEGTSGFEPEQVKKVLEDGGKLTLAQALRCRVRYFSDGVALGSKEYVESVFQSHRGYFSAKRKTGARPMRKADWGGLCTARALRLEPVALSALSG
ncbi:MAG: transposase [Desulfuromonadales bacterium]|nr:transposase [Desulfuromonadales bacterium]